MGRGDPGGIKCAGIQTASCRNYAPSDSFSKALAAGNQEASLSSFSILLFPLYTIECCLTWTLLCCLPHQAQIVPSTPTGVLFCCLACQACRGTHWVGSYSVLPCVRCLMVSIFIVQLPVLTGGERETTVMAPPPIYDSVPAPSFHGCLAFF